MTDETLAAICAEYAPYDRFPEFQEGFDAHAKRQFDNPYGSTVAGQAWDRGLEAASRWWLIGHRAGRRGAAASALALRMKEGR